MLAERVGMAQIPLIAKENQQVKVLPLRVCPTTEPQQGTTLDDD